MAKKDDLKIRDPAPKFKLIDQDNRVRRLDDYIGRWLVLYFYPRDDTPGCTQEACRFRDDYAKLDALEADIVGISIDTKESHAGFANKHDLPFPLLSDIGGKVAKRYHSHFSFGPLRFAKRHSFIIDPQGHIAKIYRSVDPRLHSEVVVKDLSALRHAAMKTTESQ